MRGKAWRIWAGLALGATALGAQETPPVADFGATIDVRAVNVEVVVTDRRGQRVQGLKAGDFRLLVDGRPVPIDYFNEVGGRPVTSPPAGMPVAAGTPPAETVSAPPAFTGGAPTSYLVFVDESFQVGADRDLMLELLSRDLPIGPEDRMAIVAFDGRKLDRMRDWTGDREALRRTLEEMRRRPTHGAEQLARRQQAAEDDPSGEAELAVGASEIQSAAGAAAAAMRGLSLPPGRKVLLLIAGDWPALPRRPLLTFPVARSRPLVSPSPGRDARSQRLAQPGPEDPALAAVPSLLAPPEPPQTPSPARPATDWFEPVTGTANLLGYTIYPVRGPRRGPGTVYDGAEAAEITPFSEVGFISTEWGLGASRTSGYLAHETGGQVLFNSLRRSAFARLTEDLRSYYGLGFTPVWHADGRNHQIVVQVAREGLTVRSRSSFADLSKGQEARFRTDSLLLFGGSAEVEKLQVQLGEPRKAGRGTIELPVTLLIPARTLKPTSVPGGYVLQARLSIRVVDPQRGETERRDVPLLLRTPSLPLPQDFTRYRTTLKLQKSQQKLTFAVEDEAGAGLAWAQLDYKP